MKKIANRQGIATIIIPGLFEKINQSFLSKISCRLIDEGFSVDSFECFSDIGKNTFESLIRDLSIKLDNIIQEGRRPIIIGHSLGAFLSLFVSKKCQTIICLDVSLHPLEMFSTIICKDGQCAWPKISHILPDTFVKSADNLKSINEIMKSIMSKTYFIGSRFAGAEISRRYYNLNPNLSEYDEYATDHDFTGCEEKISDVVIKIIKTTI